MTNEIVRSIKLFVQSTPSPALADLIESDWPRLEMVKYLVSKLAGISLALNIDVTEKMADFVSPSGQKLLHIERAAPHQISACGDLSAQLRAMLFAIRIHEVESYDWVYLPPTMRQDKVAQVLAKEGIDGEQFRRLTAIWTVL